MLSKEGFYARKTLHHAIFVLFCTCSDYKTTVKDGHAMKRINSTEIAKLAGVSRSTVSRVINNYPNVPEATREHVMRIIKENHYFPQLSGKMLTGKHSHTIGLFWITDSTSIANDTLSSRYFMSIVDEAASKNYLVLAMVVRNLYDPENIQFVRRIFSEGRIDAGIFVGADLNTPLISDLLDAGEILGIFDYTDPAHHPNMVAVNFEQNSGEKIIDYLYGIGHRKIAIINGNMARLSCIQRNESFLRGMQKHGLPIRNEWLVYAGITKGGGYRAAKQLLQNSVNDLPSVICANNDWAAYGVYQALYEQGISIGDQISVIGIDGHPHNELALPGLTSVEFNFREMFSLLVDRVLDLVETGKTAQNEYYLEGKLIVRKSCKEL